MTRQAAKVAAANASIAGMATGFGGGGSRSHEPAAAARAASAEARRAVTKAGGANIMYSFVVVVEKLRLSRVGGVTRASAAARRAMAEPGIDIAGDLAEIEIVSFETAERKPEEAEVERVEVRALWCGGHVAS